jgi:hypothetical protein
MKNPTTLHSIILVLVALLLAACGPEQHDLTFAAGAGGGGGAPAAYPEPDASAPAEPLSWGGDCEDDLDCPAVRPHCLSRSCVAVVDVPLGCMVPAGNGAPPLCDDRDQCSEDLVQDGACFHRALPDGTSCVLWDYGGGPSGEVPGTCHRGYCCGGAYSGG